MGMNQTVVRFEVFMAVKIKVNVLCVVMPCNVVGCQCFRDEDGGSMNL
jgi:hypothetical protein